MHGVRIKISCNKRRGIFCILGQNGTGKSTLLKCIVGEEKATGHVLVDGKDGDRLTARTDGGRLVHLKGDPALIGQFAEVTITASNTWALYGELSFQTETE